jgi:hypothetical protein
MRSSLAKRIAPIESIASPAAPVYFRADDTHLARAGPSMKFALSDSEGRPVLGKTEAPLGVYSMSH